MTWVIVGAGAQGRVLLEAIQATITEAKVVFLDDAADRVGQRVGGVPVVGRASLVHRTDARAVIAVGRNDVRLRLARELRLPWGIVVHPSATVAPSATLGPGTVILAGAVVHTGAEVGEHALVNTRAVVEHDCVVGRGVSLAPGVVMGGRVRIDDGVFVGVGAVLVPRVRVGAGAVIGAGAVVTRDVPAGALAYGNPARVVRSVDPDRDWPRLL
jgi:sugar O-acyltransferase (sialic acid O-acetyltransferase NeuD family)